MVKIGSSYLSASKVEAGKKITFKDEGEWVDSQYMKEDKVTPKRQFIMTVDYEGQEMKMRINKTNSDILVEAYGDETQEWIGKQATITIKSALVAGKDVDCIILVVPDAEAEASPAKEGEEIPF